MASVQNPLVKAWRALNKSRSAREESGLYLAEGEHMAKEALKENKADALILEEINMTRYNELIERALALHVPVYALKTPVFKTLCDAKTPQGVMALCTIRQAAQAPAAPLIVALDAVQDPGNVGTIMRTLDAAGGCALVLGGGSADSFSPKALRASMGAVFRVPVWETRDLASFLEDKKHEGYQVLAGALDGEPFYSRGADGDKVVLVIGNEGMGISPEVMRCATRRLKLPMRGGAESLNAAVACAVMVYDLLRARIC